MQPWKVSAGLTTALAGVAVLLVGSRLDYLAPFLEGDPVGGCTWQEAVTMKNQGATLGPSEESLQRVGCRTILYFKL